MKFHALGWFVAWVLLVVYLAGPDVVAGNVTSVGQLGGLAIYVFVPALVLAAVLWGIDVGLLAALRRAARLAPVAKAMIAALAIYLVLGGHVVLWIATFEFSLEPNPRPYHIALGIAAVPATAVFASHWWFASRDRMR